MPFVYHWLRPRVNRPDFQSNTGGGERFDFQKLSLICLIHPIFVSKKAWKKYQIFKLKTVLMQNGKFYYLKSWILKILAILLYETTPFASRQILILKLKVLLGLFRYDDWDPGNKNERKFLKIESPGGGGEGDYNESVQLFQLCSCAVLACDCIWKFKDEYMSILQTTLVSWKQLQYLISAVVYTERKTFTDSGTKVGQNRSDAQCSIEQPCMYSLACLRVCSSKRKSINIIFLKIVRVN